MKIKISGPACAFDFAGKQITDLKTLQSIETIKSNGEKCADYLNEAMSSLGIAGGELYVYFDGTFGMLRVVAEYDVEQELSERELLDLKEFTLAQWSDGVAENGLENQGQTGEYSICVYPLPYDRYSVKVVRVQDGIAKFFLRIIKNVWSIRRRLFAGKIDKIGRYRRTPLMQAILENDEKRSIDLLARGAKVTHQDEDNCTCLQFAATSGNLRIVSALLEAGASANQRGQNGTTAIMWAANRGRKEICELLIENGADLNIVSYEENTALSMASPAALDVVELLLSSGADPLIPTKYGVTASEGEFWQMNMRRQSKFKVDQDWADLCEAKAKLLQVYETTFHKNFSG